MVAQAGAIGEDRQVMILGTGEPLRILDVAKRLIEMSGKEIEIIFTGLRHGGKLHEGLISDDGKAESPLSTRTSRALAESAEPSAMNLASWIPAANDKLALAVSGKGDGAGRHFSKELSVR